MVMWAVCGSFERVCVSLYLSVGRLSDLLEVIVRSSRDLTEEDLLGHTTSQHHAHSVEQLLPAVQILLLGQILSVTQTLTTGDD